MRNPNPNLTTGTSATACQFINGVTRPPTTLPLTLDLQITLAVALASPSARTSVATLTRMQDSKAEYYWCAKGYRYPMARGGARGMDTSTICCSRLGMSDSESPTGSPSIALSIAAALPRRRSPAPLQPTLRPGPPVECLVSSED